MYSSSWHPRQVPASLNLALAICSTLASFSSTVTGSLGSSFFFAATLGASCLAATGALGASGFFSSTGAVGLAASSFTAGSAEAAPGDLLPWHFAQLPLGAKALVPLWQA